LSAAVRVVRSIASSDATASIPAVAGIVHEHVQASEGRNRRLEGRLGLRFIGHIQRDSTNFPGVSALKLDELFWIAGCRDHAISCLKYRFCERTAEAARSTVMIHTFDLNTLFAVHRKPAVDETVNRAILL
jgi:hypothetical protein